MSPFRPTTFCTAVYFLEVQNYTFSIIAQFQPLDNLYTTKKTKENAFDFVGYTKAWTKEQNNFS